MACVRTVFSNVDLLSKFVKRNLESWKQHGLFGDSCETPLTNDSTIYNPNGSWKLPLVIRDDQLGLCLPLFGDFLLLFFFEGSKVNGNNTHMGISLKLLSYFNRLCVSTVLSVYATLQMACNFSYLFPYSLPQTSLPPHLVLASRGPVPISP